LSLALTLIFSPRESPSRLLLFLDDDSELLLLLLLLLHRDFMDSAHPLRAATRRGLQRFSAF